jgi:mannose-6-phosphate isomerase-like protein (cupin superfamily)
MERIFCENIEQSTVENDLYRKVIYTGKYMQFVLMSVIDNIHLETHKDVDQFIKIEQGTGKAILNGIEYALEDGIGLIIPAGVEHKIINTGPNPLKLYSIYAPPEHPHGRIDVKNPDSLVGGNSLTEKLKRKYQKYKNKYILLKKKYKENI